MTKYEYPKESVKTRIINRLNYLSKWIDNYNKNPPIYLATPNMLKRFERMFTETALKLHGLTQDSNKKWLGRYHGEVLKHTPYHDFRIESQNAIQYWVKLYMPLDPQKNKTKYEAHYLGLVTNKEGRILDFKMDVTDHKLLNLLNDASMWTESVLFNVIGVK